MSVPKTAEFNENKPEAEKHSEQYLNAGDFPSSNSNRRRPDVEMNFLSPIQNDQETVKNILSTTDLNKNSFNSKQTSYLMSPKSLNS